MPSVTTLACIVESINNRLLMEGVKGDLIQLYLKILKMQSETPARYKQEQLPVAAERAVNNVLAAAYTKGAFTYSGFPEPMKKWAKKILAQIIQRTIKEDPMFFKNVVRDRASISDVWIKLLRTLMVLRFINDKYPRYHEPMLLNWFKSLAKSIQRMNFTEFQREWHRHADLISVDDDGFPRLPPKEVNMDNPNFHAVADLKTVWNGKGLIVKELSDEDQIPRNWWVDVEYVGGDSCKYCVTVSPNYYRQYSGGEPMYWVVSKSGEKFLQEAMVIPGSFEDDPENALRGPRNEGMMDLSMFATLAPFLKRFVPKDQPPTHTFVYEGKPYYSEGGGTITPGGIYEEVHGKRFVGKWGGKRDIPGSALDMEEESRGFASVLRDYVSSNSVKPFEWYERKPGGVSGTEKEIEKEAVRTLSNSKYSPEKTPIIQIEAKWDYWVDDAFYVEDFDDLVAYFDDKEMAKEEVINRLGYDPWSDEATEEQKEEWEEEAFPMHLSAYFQDLLYQQLKDRGYIAVGGGENFGIVISRQKEPVIFVFEE